MSARMASFDFTLSPASDCLFRSTPARSLHAALLQEIDRLAPALASLLHDAAPSASSVTHAWTIGPLDGPLEPTSCGALARADQRYRVRITALSGPVADLLAEILPPRRERMLTIEHTTWRLVAPAGPGGDGEEINQTTYASLLACASAARVITLHWRSPVAFRRGDGFAPLPEPRLCLESYLRRWNTFADPAERLDATAILAHAERSIHVRRAALEERTVDLGVGRVRGHVGTISWEVGGPPDLLRRVNALADYASYCGTGIKTAWGLGQTVRLVPRPER